MTYFGFLLYFVLFPILALGIIAARDEHQAKKLPGFDKAQFWHIVVVHVLLALVYTTPWDNYLVASGVWSYNPRQITGIVFGWVPLEEYIFFIVETILSSLWWLFIARRVFPTGDFAPNRRSRTTGSAALAALWLLFAGLFFASVFSPELKPANYLAITLSWVLPAILPQFVFGADILWHYRKLLFWAIFVPGSYLSLVDMIALKEGIWAISPAHTTGILFFGILPLEEVLFFFVTNILIAFGLTLMLSNISKQRAAAWRLGGFKGLP